MRALLVLGFALSACVSTTLEPAAHHPSNPGAAPPRTERATAVLEPGFEPFERYVAPEPAEDPHAGHGAHGDPGHAPAAGDVYTCPMHPEVKRNAPGNCPKCGMKLVPAKKAPEGKP